MSRLSFASLLLLCLAASPAAAQYTVEPAGPCSCEGVSDAVKSALETDGYRVKDSGGAPYVEVWLAKAIPAEKKGATRGADFTIPPTSLVGVIRFVKGGGDFRGQPIKPGVYTMRYNLQPEDGDHQGASPRRDHVLLAPVTLDTNPSAQLTYEAAVDLSRKASGTAHPSVLFLSMPESSAQFPSVKRSDNREILHVKSGSVGLGIVIVGKAEE